MLLESGLVPHDGILDAIDCHIEESFTDIFGWRNPKYEMIADPQPDKWIQYQIDQGTAIPAAVINGVFATSG